MLLVSVYLVRETAIVVPDCLLPSAEMQRRYPEARLQCTAIVDDGTPVVDAFAMSGIPLCERRSLIS
jgi:hypothetical protein